MRFVFYFVVLAVAVSPLRSFAQASICAEILKGGVFDSRQLDSASANYNRTKALFCSEAASTYESAKALGASATVPIEGILVTFGLKANSTDYTQWHSQLCSANEALYFSKAWTSEKVQTASRAILKSFNECVAQLHGTYQYVTLPEYDAKYFSWTVIYSPDGQDPSINISPKTTANVRCDGMQRRMTVGPQGHTFACERKNCDSGQVILNATRRPQTPVLNLSAIRVPSFPPVEAHVESVDVAMDKPISVAIPNAAPDEKCEFYSGSGNWNAGPNGALPHACAIYPHPSVIGGVAAADFDSYYGDNSGTCSYKFSCKKIATTPQNSRPTWCSTK